MDESQRARIDRVITYRDDMRKYALILATGETGESCDAVRERILQGAGIMQPLLQRVRSVMIKPQPYNRGQGTNVWTLALYPSPGYNQAQFVRVVADELTMLIGQLEADPSLLDPPPPPKPMAAPPSSGPQTINIHDGTVNIAQTASGDVTQHNAAVANLAAVRQLINDLIGAIGDLDAPEEERESFVAPVETLKAELRQSRPLAGRLLAAYGAVQAFGTVESAWQGWERVQRVSGELAPHLHQLIQAMTQGQ